MEGKHASTAIEAIRAYPRAGRRYYFLLLLPSAPFWAGVLARLLPDSLFYANAEWSLLHGAISPLTLLVLAGGWYCAGYLHSLAARGAKWRGRGIDRLATGGAALSLALAALAHGVLLPHGRFLMNARYCTSPLLETLERCEGRDESYRRNFWVSALYGTPVANIQTAIKALPHYDILEVPCATLPGGFGKRCFAGTKPADQYGLGDIAIYLADNKILVLQTEHVALPFEPRESTYWVDMERFRGAMTE